MGRAPYNCYGLSPGGLSRNGVISSLESNIGCCRAPSPALWRLLSVSLSASSGFCFCFYVFFFFLSSGFLWELGLCAPESILHSGLIWHAPFYTDVFICVCLGLPRYRAKLLWHLYFSPWVCIPPLCLTKPVHCFLVITRDRQGRKGAQPWEVGGRQGQV